MIRLAKGVFAEGCALFIKKEKAMVISDLHLGMESSLLKGGVLIPKTNFRAISERVRLLLRKLKPELIVFNGDLKHHFGAASYQEKKEIRELVKAIAGKKVVAIKGNHDKSLGYFQKAYGFEIRDALFFKDSSVFVCHGDRLFVCQSFCSAKIVAIGHEHPALTIKSPIRAETFKAFLKGKLAFNKANIKALLSRRDVVADAENFEISGFSSADFYSKGTGKQLLCSKKAYDCKEAATLSKEAESKSKETAKKANEKKAGIAADEKCNNIQSYSEEAAKLKKKGIQKKRIAFFDSSYKKAFSKERELIVMPSFTMASAGVDIMREKQIGPFLDPVVNAFPLMSFEAFVVENGKIYGFGKLGEL